MLSYTSSDENVVEVSENGMVTIKGTGTAIITVSLSGNNYTNAVSQEITITVNKADEEKNPEDSKTESSDTNGNNSSTDSTGTNKTNSSLKTGDTFMPAVCIMLLLLSGGCFVYFSSRRRK